MNVSPEEIQVMVEKISRQVVLLRRKNSQPGAGTSSLPCKLLLSVEAQLISNTLQSFITDSEIAVSRLAFLHVNNIVETEDKELMRCLEEHQVLAKTLEELEITQTEAGQENWAKLQTDFMKSVRNLFKHFRANPEDIFDLKRRDGCQVSETAEMFNGALRTFHKHIVERLKTNPDEELHRLLHVPAPSSIAQKVKDVNKLEEEMSALTKTVDLKIHEKNEEINGLESQLQEDHSKELPSLSDERCQPHIKSSEMRQAATQKEIDELSTRLKSLILENKDNERELQEKNERLEIEIEEFLHDFDEKMEESQAKLEKVQTLLNQEQGEISQLEEPYAALKHEYDLVMERRQQLELRRQEEAEELKVKTQAAIVIQAYWRGHSTRNTMKRKSKVKKSKSKKKERKTKMAHKQQ
ncbi:dynein regulatory complex protein 10-like [Synchiropus picturatus]